MARSKPLPRASPSPTQLVGVQRLREARVRPARDLSLANDMDRALREATSLRRSVGACAAAWSGVLPPELLPVTSLEGMARGVLTVRVPDAAARFQVDRFLRSGGQKRLAAACATSIRQVRIVIGK